MADSYYYGPAQGRRGYYPPEYYDPYYDRRPIQKERQPQEYNRRPEPPYEESESRIPIMVVSSEEEAWRTPPDWGGSKQYFRNEKDDTFYVQWFDAGVPKTFREVYVRVPKEIVEPVATSPQPAIETYLDEIKGQISELKEMLLSAPNNADDIPVLKGKAGKGSPRRESGRDNESSNSSGTVE